MNRVSCRHDRQLIRKLKNCSFTYYVQSNFAGLNHSEIFVLKNVGNMYTYFNINFEKHGKG